MLSFVIKVVDIKFDTFSGQICIRMDEKTSLLGLRSEWLRDINNLQFLSEFYFKTYFYLKKVDISSRQSGFFFLSKILYKFL